MSINEVPQQGITGELSPAAKKSARGPFGQK